MDDFKTEYIKIEETYYAENPLKALMEQKAVTAEIPTILYGCGVDCGMVMSICEELGLKISALCDTYKTGIYHDTGHNIISPEQLKKEYPNADVIICSIQFEAEIKKTLKSLGFSDEQIYPPLAIKYLHPSVFARDYCAGYEWAYNLFNDDISKKLLLDRIRMYFMGTELQRTSDASAYFEPGIICLNSNEVFVDCGAFDGNTSREFVRQIIRCNIGGYRHIYSFEPDELPREKAIRNLQNYENVDVIGKGLWSSDTELKFFSDGGNASSSFVRGIQTISVPVTSIDSFFEGKPYEELPTFIKMDIEGSEKEALIGAKNVIRLKHPKLAICAYHKREDIYELPMLINEIDPSYNFSLRQHEDGIYETVLYAI